MKLLCYSKVVILFMILSSFLFANERYAFIYSKNIDDKFINFYDKVVVEADAIDNIYAIRYPKKMVAYVSVGEIEPWRKTKTKYQDSWIISENKTWNSLIADLRKEAYQNFIFERVETLYKKGYRNFFLDTMDAYHVTAEDKKLFKLQQKALISFIHKLHKKYPDSQLIINRGFELLDEIHQDINAVVAESLLKRYDHNQKKYLNVPQNDKEWLLEKFKKVQKYHLTAISIEYSDQGSKERQEVAKKIKKLNITPYVTDGLLQGQGECEIERIRREILILFNQSVFKDKKSVYSDVHLLASMPLEYLGYIPILHDLSTKELPKRVEDKYHAVIVWSNTKSKNDEAIYEWTKKLKSKKIKIVFLNNLLFKPLKERLSHLGIKEEKNENTFTSQTHTLYHSGYKSYEIDASVDYEEQLIHVNNAKKVVSIQYENGQTSVPIAITSWGGYALHDSFLKTIGNESFWTINPFIFFKEALQLDTIPMPDPTTEAGRRILFVHVDGDGFMEEVRTNHKLLSTEYLIKHIYKKYPIPHTLSIIQGEVDKIGLYPKLSERMKAITRGLYKLPWVEPASHTLSHPFFWNETKQANNDASGDGKKYHLDIPNYHYSLKSETKESVKFALSLAPKSKQKTKILFWSGDCLPTKATLAYVEREKILTMNGGDTTIKKSQPWLSHIAPFGLQYDEYWQVYTGQQNENVYTNDWLGPYWGYRDVIETFQMTEKPYRLKPINIYYHFYSGSKLASANAVKEVYQWAIKEKTSKLYASQYIKKVQGFYHTSMARITGGFEIKNSGSLRTLRIDNLIHVEMKKSKGVAGYIHENNSTYITLDKQEKHLLFLSQKEATTPYLIDSNGWVNKVTQNKNYFYFELESNMPIEANFFMPQQCKVHMEKIFIKTIKKHILSIKNAHKKRTNIVFNCQ